MGPQDLFATGLPPDDSFGCVGTVNWRPDLDSIKPLPYHPTNYWSAADLHTDDGLPWAYCPRSILKRQLSQLKEKYGAEFVIGPEFEFHMFKEYDQGTGRPSMWLTHQAGEILGLRGTPGKVMDTICTTLGAAGIDLNNWHCEGGGFIGGAGRQLCLSRKFDRSSLFYQATFNGNSLLRPMKLSSRPITWSIPGSPSRM